MTRQLGELIWQKCRARQRCLATDFSSSAELREPTPSQCAAPLASQRRAALASNYNADTHSCFNFVDGATAGAVKNMGNDYAPENVDHLLWK